MCITGYGIMDTLFTAHGKAKVQLSHVLQADEAGAAPEITLGFKDGTSATICDSAWRVPSDLTAFGQYGVAAVSTSGQENEDGGHLQQAFLFAQVVSLEELDTITINGAIYQVNYEIG